MPGSFLPGCQVPCHRQETARVDPTICRVACAAGELACGHPCGASCGQCVAWTMRQNGTEVMDGEG